MEKKVNVFALAETASPQLLITECHNSVVSGEDISIDQSFFCLFFFTYHVITRISSRVRLYFIVIDQINKVSEDGLKSSPKISRYIENTLISSEKIDK